jgi:hypothetical protein
MSFRWPEGGRAACGLLAFAWSRPHRSCPRQPAATPASHRLTVSVGPRDGVWKRVFNPLLYEADTRWPSWAGVYEPMLVYNRATATYMPWLATRYDWSDNNQRLRFALRQGVTWSDGAPFTARDVVFTFDLLRPLPRARPGQDVGLPVRRDRRRSRHRRVRVQAGLHAGAGLDRPAPDRVRAQVEGRGQPRRLRRPEPGGHRPLHRGRAVRAARV